MRTKKLTSPNLYTMRIDLEPMIGILAHEIVQAYLSGLKSEPLTLDQARTRVVSIHELKKNDNATRLENAVRQKLADSLTPAEIDEIVPKLLGNSCETSSIVVNAMLKSGFWPRRKPPEKWMSVENLSREGYHWIGHRKLCLSELMDAVVEKENELSNLGFVGDAEQFVRINYGSYYSNVSGMLVFYVNPDKIAELGVTKSRPVESPIAQPEPVLLTQAAQLPEAQLEILEEMVSRFDTHAVTWRSAAIGNLERLQKKRAIDPKAEIEEVYERERFKLITGPWSGERNNYYFYLALTVEDVIKGQNSMNPQDRQGRFLAPSSAKGRAQARRLVFVEAAVARLDQHIRTSLQSPGGAVDDAVAEEKRFEILRNFVSVLRHDRGYFARKYQKRKNDAPFRNQSVSAALATGRGTENPQPV